MAIKEKRIVFRFLEIFQVFISQSNKKGNDSKSDQTQIFVHHHLSAIIPPKAFHRAKQTTKLIEINAQVFRE